MSWNRAQVRAQARIWAKDPNSSCPDANVNAYFTDVYARYDFAILREREKKVSGFVTFVQDAFDATSSQPMLDIRTLEAAVGSVVLEKDDFYAVFADSKQFLSDSRYSSASGVSRRFGAMKLQNSNYWRVAIWPPSLGADRTFAAVGHAEATPITDDSTALDCYDVDALNITRLVARAIMLENGDDPQDIAEMLRDVDPTVLEKMQVLAQRQPRQTGAKGQN